MLSSNLSKLASLVALTSILSIGCAGQSDPNGEDVAGAASALVSIDGPSCSTLFAGQFTNAGTVCTSISGSDLVVSYATIDGWELTTAHMWVGENLADMPQTQNGNPKIGNFPYNSGDITGAISFSFSVPLASLGGDPYVCDKTYFMAAHAALQKPGADTNIRTETGWAGGSPLVDKGSWATYTSVTFGCEEPPPPEPICETAFALGGATFIDLGITDSRWGWELGPIAPGTYSTSIYAGAGQNDLAKGELVGTLHYSYDGSNVTVTYSMNEGFTLDETHLYVGTTHLSTVAPGQFGNIHDLDGASSDSFSVGSFSGEDVFLAAHAVVCH